MRIIVAGAGGGALAVISVLYGFTAAEIEFWLITIPACALFGVVVSRCLPLLKD